MACPISADFSLYSLSKDFSLRGNDIHTWIVQVDGESFCLACCEQSLSSDEKERASRFKFQRDRSRYIISHAALRSVLSAYLTMAPKELLFSTGSNGKPKLVPIEGKQTIQFNLTHSHDVALIAVTQDRDIGVDVEWVKTDFPIHEIAQRFFTTKEVATIDALPNHLQREAFFKCWTSKEAYLKAKGTGLSGKLDEVEIVLKEDGAVRIKGTVPNWSLAELSPGSGYVGALVIAGEEFQIKYYRWDGLDVKCSH